VMKQLGREFALKEVRAAAVEGPVVGRPARPQRREP